MTPRRPRAVLAVIGLLLVSACGGSSSTAGNPDDVSASNVNVATPDMIALKAKSQVEACPAAQVAKGGLPKVTLPCLGGGRSVDLSTLKGPLVINVFQAGCVECIKEEPALAAFHRHHGATWPVLGIDGLDTYPGVALREAINRGVTYPLVADPGGDALSGPLNIRGFPTFFFLHADGSITQAVGGKTSEAQILEMVQQQFGPQAAAKSTSGDLVVAAIAIVVVAGGAGFVVRRRSARGRA